MFQARHLNHIAATILSLKDELDPAAYTALAVRFTKRLEASPGFDPVRFLKACGWAEDTAALVFDPNEPKVPKRFISRPIKTAKLMPGGWAK